MLTLKSTQIAN